MSTLNLQCDESGDDATVRHTDGTMFITQSYAYLGDFYGQGHVGLRFPTVSGLSGATINTATITFVAYASDSGAFQGDWYADDVAAPAIFAAAPSAQRIETRPRTTATCEGDGSHFGSWVTTPPAEYTFTGDGVNTIADIIQELADSYDPSAIALLWIYTSGTGERCFRPWDNSSATAPKLDIDYTAVSGDIVLTPDPVAMPLAVPTATLDMGAKTLTPAPLVLALLLPTVTVKPPDTVLTPDPVLLPLVVPSVDVTVAIMLRPAPVTMPVVVPSISLDMGVKTLTPTPIELPLIIPVVTVTGIEGAIVFAPYRWTRTLNPSEFPDGGLVHIVVMLRTTDAGTPARARLFNVTDGLEVAGSELSTTETALTEVVGPGVSLPSGSKLYRVEVGGLQGGEFHCEDAMVKVVSS